MIIVQIKYKLVNESEWHIIDLCPEDYFDTGEPLNRDGAPKFDHAREYLPTTCMDLKVTILTLYDAVTTESTRIVETFWNRNKNRIIERFDSDMPGSEIIVQSQIADDPVVNEVIRMTREEGLYNILYHGYITDNEDGSQTEKRCEDKDG